MAVARIGDGAHPLAHAESGDLIADRIGEMADGDRDVCDREGMQNLDVTLQERFLTEAQKRFGYGEDRIAETAPDPGRKEQHLHSRSTRLRSLCDGRQTFDVCPPTRLHRRHKHPIVRICATETSRDGQRNVLPTRPVCRETVTGRRVTTTPGPK